MHKLILCPCEPTDAPPEPMAMVERLVAIGFIRGDQRELDQGYAVGDGFTRLITFLGCSPVVAHNEAGAEAATSVPGYVSLSAVSDQVEFIAGDKLQPPRCPSCKQLVPSWEQAIANWRTEPAATDWQCPACGYQGSIYTLDWRRAAGFARFHFAVYPVYPAEAVPGERLLAELGQFTESAWQYFYL